MALVTLLSRPVAAGADALFERQSADGSIELTNLPDDRGGYEALDVPMPPAQAPTALAPAGLAPNPASTTPADRLPPALAIRADGAPPSAQPVVPPRPGFGAGTMRASLKALYDAARTAHRP